MPGDIVLRVVVVRKGKLKATEFRLRQGEPGLSLFRAEEHLSAEALIKAVRAAGKQGDLAVAEIPVGVIHRLGLKLVATPGGTSDPLVNGLHVEARPSFLRRLALWFRREAVHDWFNEHITPELAAAAKIID